MSPNPNPSPSPSPNPKPEPEQDRQMLLLRSGRKVVPLAQAGVPVHRRFTFYDQVHERRLLEGRPHGLVELLIGLARGALAALGRARPPGRG